jgi:hypothetical protein
LKRREFITLLGGMVSGCSDLVGKLAAGLNRKQ